MRGCHLSEDQIQSQEKQKPFVNTQWKWKVKLLVVQLCLTLWNIACQSPVSMGFSRQEHWSGLLCLPQGDPPDPGMEAGSPALQGLLQRWATREALLRVCLSLTNPVEYWGFACQMLQSHPTLCDPMDCSTPGSSVPGISQGKNTWVGCHFLLQGIFLTQGSNPPLLCLLHL